MPLTQQAILDASWDAYFEGLKKYKWSVEYAKKIGFPVDLLGQPEPPRGKRVKYGK